MISLWDIRTSRTLTINTISASLFFWAEDSSVTHPLVVFRTTVFFCFLRTMPVYNLLHMYARTTGASTKQKKSLRQWENKNCTESLSVFKSTNTVAFRTQKRYASIVCLLFCEKNLFYFYNHKRNSRLLAILRNVLCKLPVLGKLLLLFFEIILLFVGKFLYKSEKKHQRVEHPWKKGSHVLCQKSVNKVKKNLYMYMQKKKVLP